MLDLLHPSQLVIYLRYKVKEEDKHQFEQSWKDGFACSTFAVAAYSSHYLRDSLGNGITVLSELSMLTLVRRLPSSTSGKKDICLPGT